MNVEEPHRLKGVSVCTVGNNIATTIEHHSNSNLKTRSGLGKSQYLSVDLLEELDLFKFVIEKVSPALQVLLQS